MKSDTTACPLWIQGVRRGLWQNFISFSGLVGLYSWVTLVLPAIPTLESAIPYTVWGKKHLFLNKRTGFYLLINTCLANIYSQRLYVSALALISRSRGGCMQPGQSCASEHCFPLTTSYFRVCGKAAEVTSNDNLSSSLLKMQPSNPQRCLRGNLIRLRTEMEIEKSLTRSRQELRKANTNIKICQATKHRDFASFQEIAVLTLECYTLRCWGQ